MVDLILFTFGFGAGLVPAVLVPKAYELTADRIARIRAARDSE